MNVVQPVPEIVNWTPFLTSYPLRLPVNVILADYGNVMLLMSVAKNAWSMHDEKPCDDNKEVPGCSVLGYWAHGGWHHNVKQGMPR
jgi:hypothetical protein